MRVAAFRVVQEALTNAQKHGQGSVEVSLRRQAQHLVIEVTNPYTPRSSSEERGYGLVGMRERVESVGGQLSIDPSEKRLRILARIPVEGAA